MENDLRVKQFSNALFSYVYRVYNDTYKFSVRLPRFPESNTVLEDTGKAVMKLCRTFRPTFTVVFDKKFSQIKRSMKHFITYLTSQCMKLCSEDLFLSLIIICAFIAELNLFCCLKGCYTFISTAPKCFTAIFNRRLRKEFNSCGGWERLTSFCESFVYRNGKEAAQDPSDDVPSPESAQNMLEILENNSSSEESTSNDSDSESSMDESGATQLNQPQTNMPTTSLKTDSDEEVDESESSASEDEESESASSESGESDEESDESELSSMSEHKLSDSNLIQDAKAENAIDSNDSNIL